jgi:hypothetical protein
VRDGWSCWWSWNRREREGERKKLLIKYFLALYIPFIKNWDVMGGSRSNGEV